MKCRKKERRAGQGAPHSDNGRPSYSSAERAAQAFTRCYRLPHGYVAEFRIELDCPELGFRCQWSPRFPVIHANRARRKFFDAYVAARGDFLQDVVQMIGGSAVVADTGERAGQVTVIEPRAVQ